MCPQFVVNISAKRSHGLPDSSHLQDRALPIEVQPGRAPSLRLSFAHAHASTHWHTHTDTHWHTLTHTLTHTDTH
eukprot:3224164-Rhodomonas_salina.1